MVYKMISSVLHKVENNFYFDNTSVFNRNRYEGSRMRKQRTAISLHLPFRANRAAIESFIWDGFKKHYQADIQHFLPNIISVSHKGAIASALGFRSAAEQPLHLEQYMNGKIENFFEGQNIQRDQIGEIGNLYGTNHLLTQQLFIVAVTALSQLGLSKLVFCATPQIKQLMSRFAVKTQYIGQADPEKLGSQVKCWGSYYDTSPQLLAVDVNEVVTLIAESQKLRKIKRSLAPSVAYLAENIVT